jgi:hypothetical protein
MTNKRTATLDEVLTEYAQASQQFDAKVLQAFIIRYPEHSQALQRYAHIQLTSVPATAEEIDSEQLSDEEMLPRQSKLLQRMQQLRHVPSASDASRALAKLSSISGEQAIRTTAIAVFRSCDHGEDLLLITVLEPTVQIRGVPQWFYYELGNHLKEVPGALVAGMELKKQQSTVLQRFSAKEKPALPPPISWEQAVEHCITDDAVKTAILERSKRS